MGPNSAMWGREAEFQCGDEEKDEFCEFFRQSVDNFHQNEVGGGRGHDIYSTLLLSPASEALHTEIRPLAPTSPRLGSFMVHMHGYHPKTPYSTSPQLDSSRRIG